MGIEGRSGMTKNELIDACATTEARRRRRTLSGGRAVHPQEAGSRQRNPSRGRHLGNRPLRAPA
ncbi:MAG: hypothetical protein H0U42_03570 [Thermoleophilaceae bacterium]|nr:hypothetical protein [Thermoleophilaceae bacterium]